MKIKHYSLILIMILPLLSLAQDTEIIGIARKVYQQPQFQEVYRDYLTPKVILNKALPLPPNRKTEIKSDPTNLWKETEDNREYYIVTFPINLDIDTGFTMNYGAQVYIWKDNKKPFIIFLGQNGMGYPPNWGATVNGNTANPYDGKEYTVTYSSDTPLKAPIIRKAKYGDIITIIFQHNVIENPNDGWTTEDYYVLNSVENGQLISKNLTFSSEGKSNTYTNIYELKFIVRGDIKINVSKIREEYEGWVN